MMKLYKIFLLFFLLNTAYAERETQNLLKIMLGLEKGVNLMQDAFLKNNQTLVLIQQRRLKKIMQEFKSIPVHYYLNDETKKFENLINLRLMRIDENLVLMGKQLKQANMDQAFDTFVKILSECNGCHVIFR